MRQGHMNMTLSDGQGRVAPLAGNLWGPRQRECLGKCEWRVVKAMGS